MIDIDQNTDLLLLADRQAKHLANFPDDRLEREIEAIRKRAEALFLAKGADDIEAWLGADSIINRLRVLIDNRRRQREAHEGAGRAETARPLTHTAPRRPRRSTGSRARGLPRAV
jgi:hypothetical protein